MCASLDQSTLPAVSFAAEKSVYATCPPLLDRVPNIRDDWIAGLAGCWSCACGGGFGSLGLRAACSPVTVRC